MDLGQLSRKSVHLGPGSYDHWAGSRGFGRQIRRVETNQSRLGRQVSTSPPLSDFPLLSLWLDDNAWLACKLRQQLLYHFFAGPDLDQRHRAQPSLDDLSNQPTLFG